MTETTYRQTKFDYTDGFYIEGDDDDPYSSGSIAGTGQVVNLVEGDLAERVLRRLSKASGTVQIIEDHWDIGYCVTCSDEMVDFEVRVDGEKVFRTEYAESGSAIIGPEYLTGYAQFNTWLGE